MDRTDRKVRWDSRLWAARRLTDRQAPLSLPRRSADLSAHLYYFSLLHVNPQCKGSRAAKRPGEFWPRFLKNLFFFLK